MENPSAVMPVTLAHGPLDLDSGIPGYHVTGEDGPRRGSTEAGFKSVLHSCALVDAGQGCSCWAGGMLCRQGPAWSQRSQS